MTPHSIRSRCRVSAQSLWPRRLEVRAHDGTVLPLMALPDLVKSKKTQHDKDWPMISRLVEVDYLAHRHAPSPERVDLWLRELRNPILLEEVLSLKPEAAERIGVDRPLLTLAGNQAALGAAIRAEEAAEREADRRYWLPLKHRLEDLRRRE